MQGTNTLAAIADWIGDAFERLSPAMFKMLSAVLPYTTPLPVAFMTADSAAKFLGMVPWVAGVLVFGLEGVGVWVTSELVDSIVEAVRTKNVKAWSIVAFLSLVVLAYISILITLNVVLEQQVNHRGGAYATVLTLICLLPLISGSMNGYRKTKLEIKTNLHLQKEHQEQLDAQIRAEQSEFKLKKAALKQGFNPFVQQTVTLNQDVAQVKEIKEKHASDYREKAIEFIERYHNENNAKPMPKDLTSHFKLDHEKNKGFMSNLIKQVGSERGWW